MLVATATSAAGVDGVEPIQLTVPPEASAAERHAADELERILPRMFRRPVTREEDAAAAVRIELRYDPSLGAEEYRLLRECRSPVIRIHGGRPRCVSYGVYGLLGDCLGCRWFIPDVERVPAKKLDDLPAAMNESHRPASEYREVYWREALNADWAARNRLNSNGAPLGERHGGKIIYGEFVHTFDRILPAAKHFDEHPGWFSMVGGRRLKEHTQLCLTHPEVLARTIAAVREWIRRRPDATIFSVSQNDRHNPCQCAACAAVDAAKGSHAGSLIAFVNRVAEAIEPDHPHVSIDTLAYQYIRRPPRRLRPSPNVIVRAPSSAALRIRSTAAPKRATAP